MSRLVVPSEQLNPTRAVETRAVETRAVETRTVVLAVAAFALLSATMAFTSNGFLEADACTHYMYARWSFAAPYFLVNVWGRPFCTALYAVPAHLGGRVGVRLTSLGVAIAIALLTRAIARGQGWRWPALAVVLTLGQPLVFLHSFAELTELPFALLMAAGFLAYQRRQWAVMALIVGLAPLSRPEGFGFVALAALALLMHGRARWWAVLALPLVAWDLTGWWMYGMTGHWWHWLAENWPYAEKSLYNAGPLLKFVAMMPAVASPLVFPATVVGAWLCLRGARDGLPVHVAAVQRVPTTSVTGGVLGYGGGEAAPARVESPSLPQRVLELAGVDVRGRRWPWFVTDHGRRCDVLIAVLPLLVLVGHSVLHWLGKMASNGEIRYMLVVAPFWGLLSARGWGWIFTTFDWKRPQLWACFIATLPLLANRYYTVLPAGSMPDWVEARQIAEWYRTSPLAKQYPYLATAHPGLLDALDLSPTDNHLRDWNKRVIDSAPPGTLLIWDRIDGLFNSDATRSIPLDEIRRAGWVPMKTPWTGGAGEWQFFHTAAGDGAPEKKR